MNKFPIEAFTPQVADYIRYVSKSNMISENIVASAALSAAGFVTSNNYELDASNLRPMWKERPNLWNIIALSSGIGKSV